MQDSSRVKARCSCTAIHLLQNSAQPSSRSSQKKLLHVHIAHTLLSMHAWMDKKVQPRLHRCSACCQCCGQSSANSRVALHCRQLSCTIETAGSRFDAMQHVWLMHASAWMIASLLLSSHTHPRTYALQHTWLEEERENQMVSTGSWQCIQMAALCKC